MEMNKFKVLLIGLFCIIESFSIKAAILLKVPNIKSSTLILKLSNHPRLIITSTNIFTQIANEAATDAFLKKSNNQIISDANQLLKRSVTKYPKIINRSVGYQNRQIYQRTFTLAYAYRVTKDLRYSSRLWKELDEANSFDDWGNKHFIDVAEILYAYSIAYDWLYDVWTPEQRKAIKNAIVEKGLKPGRKFYDHTIPKGWLDWSKVTHNWNQICNGSLIVAALAIGDEEPKISDFILAEAITNIKRSMKGYAPDGGWMEGTSYLSYAQRFNIAAIASLITATGSDQGLSNEDGFNGTGKFLVAMSGPTGKTFNFADCKERIVTSSELFWMASTFKQSYLFDFERKYSNYKVPLELIWYMQARGNKYGQTTLPLANYFKGTEVASFRSKNNDINAMYVAFKGGRNGVNHGHLDAGTFILDNQAERWINDLGGDDYNQAGYFSAGKSAKAKRWQYYNVSTQGHNTILIDDGLNSTNLNQQISSFSPISYFNSTPNKSIAVIDLTKAYKSMNSPVISAKRGFTMINGNETVVQDEVVSSLPVNMIWQIHTKAKIMLNASGTIATLSIGSKVIYAELINARGVKFEISNNFVLNNSRLIMAKNDAQSLFTKLSIVRKKVTQGSITVVFREPNKSIQYDYTTLNEWR
jgi:hypothetical protein